MSNSSLSFSRRQFVRFASVAGALPLVASRAVTAAVAGGAALVAPAVAMANGTPFSNGIDASTYTGGDGSYSRYAKDGIKLGLIEAYPVNFTDDTGHRTGWNTDMVMAALGHVGITNVDFQIGPFQTLVPGLQSSRFDLLASDVHVTPERVKVIDFTAPVFWYGDTLAVPQGIRPTSTAGRIWRAMLSEWASARTTRRCCSSERILPI